MNIDLSCWVDSKTISGAFIGASLVWVSDYIKAWHNKSKQAHYLAVRLIPILEQFLERCYAVAFDDGTYQGYPASSDGSYSPQVKEPTFDLPDDVDWRSIKKELLEKIMSISSELYTIHQNLSAAEDIFGPPYDEFMFERQLTFAKFSLKVDSVLSEVLSIIGKMPSTYSGNWNPRERCQKFVADNERRVEEGEQC